MCSWRLGSGNTFVVNRDALLEVTPEGKTAWSMKWKGLIRSGQPLRDGGTLLLVTNSNPRTAEVVLLDAERRVANRVKSASSAKKKPAAKKKR